MVQHSMGRVIAGAVITAAVCLYGIGYGYTAPGSQAAEQTQTGNYPLGCPMGGIGGGNFKSALFCRLLFFKEPLRHVSVFQSVEQRRFGRPICSTATAETAT